MKQPFINPEKLDNDNPEWTKEMFNQAKRIQHLPTSLQNKLMGRPPLDNPKQAISIRFDSEIVDYFKSQGKGWQTAMNNALKDWITAHPKP